jgi:hypothetical protein
MGKPPKTLRLVSDHGEQATDEQFVAALLAFANGGAIEIVETFPPVLIPLGGNLDELRAEFRDLLNLAVDDPAALAGRFLSSVGIRLLSSMKVSRTIGIGIGGLSLGYRQSFGTVRSALHYAIALILDPKFPYRKAISRCRLQRCGVFYLAKKNPKGGPANRLYCRPAHRDEAHDSKQNRKPK